MAANNSKDLVYPKVVPQTISAFSSDNSFSALKGSKVASLVSAINARTQTQDSPIQFKQNIVVEQDRGTSENVRTWTRTNSYNCHEIQPQTLSNRFSSEFGEDELEQAPALSVAMTRSLGRNEFLRLKPDLCRNVQHSGEVISTRSSNVSFRTMGPVSGSLKVIPKGKVESNPFFQLDRQRTNLKRSQSPTCKNQPNFNSASVNRRDHLNDSVSIKMRIKLWSEMEIEAKQKQVPIERRKSAHFPINYSETVPLGCHNSIVVSTDQTVQRSTSLSSLHVDTTKGVDKLVTTNELDSKAIGDVTAESETRRSAASLTGEDQLHVPFIHVRTGSVDKGDNISVNSDATPPANQKESPKRNVKESSSGISKGLSKLSTKLLSPRFHRKKMESEHQGDKEPAKGIGGRRNKKRKAFKSKVASTSNSNCGPDGLVLEPGSDANIQSKPGNVDDDDDVFALEELSQRASSVSEKSRKNMVITKKRAESQPIDPQQLNLTMGMQTQVGPSVLDSASLNLCEDRLKGDAAHPDFLHSKPSHQHPETKVYRDTCEVIDSLGNASDSEIRIFGSDESSSDSEPCTTNTKSGIYTAFLVIDGYMCVPWYKCFFYNVFVDGPACSIQSCLNKEVIPSRSALKRRASENVHVKSSIHTSPEKISRIGSISPYQDVSLSACISSTCTYFGFD